MSENETRKPPAAVLIVTPETQTPEPDLSPQDAPPIDAPPADEEERPKRRRGLGFWARLFLFAGGVVLSVMIAFSLERLVIEAREIAPWVGWVMRAFVVALLIALGVLILRELAAIGRIRRVSRIRRLAEITRRSKATRDADATLSALKSLYDGRDDLGREPGVAVRLAAGSLDAVDKLRIFERQVCGPLDERARAAVRRAARDVATVTAMAPSVLIDAVAALYLNLRLIRRLSQIYGGRAGFFGSLGLARRVVEHAMAAGLIALGDDMLEPLMGGGVASKVSRRLGEGVVNGAMTARIGLAAMEVCRPLPFDALARPRLREIAWSALRSRGGKRDAAAQEEI